MQMYVHMIHIDIRPFGLTARATNIVECKNNKEQNGVDLYSFNNTNDEEEWKKYLLLVNCFEPKLKLDVCFVQGNWLP